MRVVIVLTLMLATGGVSFAGDDESVLGSKLRLDLLSGAELTGELLAVESESLRLLPKRGEMRDLRLDQITRARVGRDGLSSSSVMIWTLVGGVVTGALLTNACSSVSEDCGGVFLASLLSWGLVGGISAAVAGPPWRSIETDAGSLRPHARFPQGWPEEFEPEPRDRVR